MKKLPKKIYVKLEKENSNDYFLSAQETTDVWDHGDKLGIYELKEVRTLVVKSELVK